MPIKGGQRPRKLRRHPLNPLRTLTREYGDIVLFHVLMRVLLNHPDLVEHVLVIQKDKFRKSELTRRITALALIREPRR